MEWLGLFGVISLAILICAYVFERVSRPLWSGLSQPCTLLHVFRDWAIYMALFLGLLSVLEGSLRYACSIGCEPDAWRPLISLKQLH